MKDALKDKLVIILFLGFLYGLFFINIFTPDGDISLSERRSLEQFPAISWASLWSGEAAEQFGSYATDQMVFRDAFRSVKAHFTMDILRKADNNGYFLLGDMIFKTEYPLNEASVRRLGERIQYVTDKYLTDNDIYYSVVPDKNYYLKTGGHLILDYRRLEAIVQETTGLNKTYIDLFDKLNLDDYYRTDAHWRQERITELASFVLESMGANPALPAFTEKTHFPFYGVYYGQAAVAVNPDSLVYLSSEVTDNAIVSSAESEGELSVYDEAELTGMDAYNTFLLGPEAIIRAENPLADSEKELVLFRDSYGSSLAPLLLSAYQAITLIDLRYAHPDMIGEFVDFGGKDVLFIYSATIFNNSAPIQ